MSKFNILEFNKTMRTHLKGAVEGAAQKEEKARQRLREAQQLEADVMRRLEEKKLREQAAEVEMPAAPAEAPTAAVHEQSTPAPASVPQPEAPAVSAPVPAAPEKTPAAPQAPLEEKPQTKQDGESKPAKQAGKEKESMKTAAKQTTEKKVTPAKEQPQAETPKKAETKSDFSVYMPDLSAFRPKIRVVRSAKDEEAEQKKREEKQRQDRERAAASSRAARPAQDRRPGDRRNTSGASGFPKRGAAGSQPYNKDAGFGKFDKDEAPATSSQTRRAPAKKNSVFIAPQARDRHGVGGHDQKRRASEEELAAKRRRNAMKEKVILSGDDEFVRGSRKAKRKDARGASLAIEPIKIESAVITGDMVSIKVLAEKIGKPAAEIIKKLFMLGNVCTINSEIDYDTAALIADDYGITLEQKKEQTAEETLIAGFEETTDEEENLQPRPPVVTVMGHVDHGKTSLLDAIRQTKVQQGEAGGITQHIGAYTVEANGKPITFLDTPGHAAFTAMRARGAQATDIAVLVVAADDGVMPQTIEAINHAKSAGVPVIVAINKIDKPAANPDRVKQELTEYGLVSEEWGGDTIMVPVSAITGEGIDTLLEMILLVADIAELRANPNRMAKGIIIEARLDRGRGPVATVLVQNGTLHVQDTIVAGMTYGRVRAMYDDNGKAVKQAGPSMPVEVIGFSDVPAAGDIIYAVEQDKLSKQVVEERKDRLKAEKLKSMSRVSLDDLFSKIAEGQMKELNIIVKADVQGSVEALKQSLEKLSNDEVRVRVIHGAAGAISESDILLASTSNAIVIGFNVRPDAAVMAAAEREKVDVRLYRIIYNAIEDVEKAMKGLLAPEFKEEVLGHATVRQTFKVSSVGTVAGSYVTDGKIVRNAEVRLVRNGVVVYEGKLSSLKRFKDDAKEVAAGYECGITLENYNDIKEEDVIEAFQMVEVQK